MTSAFALRATARQALVCILLALGPDLAAQHGTINGEWRTWGGDLGVTRYAPLDQIDASNFSKLQVAWRFNTLNMGGRPDFNLQTTPLMIDGVLWYCDAASGWICKLAAARTGTGG